MMTVERRSVSSVRAPLTFQQELAWKFIQLHGDWNVGLYTFALRLSGSIDSEWLRKSLDELVRRHDSLRTQIVTVDGREEQWIDRPGEFVLEIIPFVNASVPENETDARAYIREFFSRRVDRAAGFFFEVKLLKLSEREHVLVLGIHHIISDAYSLSILFRELWAGYCELLQGGNISFRNEPTKYSDYAIQQQEADLEWAEKHALYWKEHLAGAMPAHVLQPRIGNATTSAHLSKFEISFDSVLSSEIRALAKHARSLSAALVMLTTYVVVVSRWCGQKDFVTQVIVSGRQLPQHGSMVGFFAHALPLRVKITGSETFIELLANLTQEFYRALTHQGFVSRRISDRSLEGGPVFNWSPGPLEELAMPTGNIRNRLAANLAIEPFVPAKWLADLAEESRKAWSPEYLGIGILFFDGTAGFRATLQFSERFLADAKLFAQDLQFTTQGCVRNPHARPFTDFECIRC